MHHRGWVSLIVTLALLSLCACGGGSSSTSATPSGQDSAPSLAELEAELTAEFERLGIDPEKVPAQAPQKDENAVFDLTTELVDPDGTGGEDPTGISLTWTERLLADYNQDGMVTQNDLTPIGQNYCFDMSLPQVGYDDPADHGGFAQWPGGDPDDGDSGSLNWRLVRIDGNADGYILQYDITPIAVHWEERLTGYRLYRLAPGEIQYSMVGLIEADRNGTDPVRYSYDNTIEAQGYHSFYVRPYDETSGTEGPASGIVTIDTASGIVNQSPVARLTVTPDFAGAPAVITLDATGSYDPDGTVTGYVWDFDGDGTADWSTGEAVPELSSNGTVTEITPVSDGIVEVTFATGSADWKYPQVAAVDDEDTQGLYAMAELGISGWTYFPLTASSTDYLIDVYPELLAVDPVTDEIIVVSKATHQEITGSYSLGLFFMRQSSTGLWEKEVLPTSFLTGIGEELILLRDVYWDENDQPVITFYYEPQGGPGQVWAAQRLTNGTWDVAERFSSDMPEHLIKCDLSSGTQTEPGAFTCFIIERLNDKADYGGSVQWHDRMHVLFYDNGTWSSGYTGYDSAESDNFISRIAGDTAETLHAFFYVRGDYTGGPWWSNWEAGSGFVNPERLDEGQQYMPSPHSYCNDAVESSVNGIATLWNYRNGPSMSYWLVRTNDTESSVFDLSETSPFSTYECSTTHGLYECPRGIGLFVQLSDSSLTQDIHSVQRHYRLEGARWIVEETMPPGLAKISPWLCDVARKSNGEPVVLLEHINSEEESDIFKSHFIAERVDPRV